MSEMPGTDFQRGDWFYIGHYGQLGPLTFDDIQELIRDGVIERNTFVWQSGMGDWTPAIQVPTLGRVFAENGLLSPPPSPPQVHPSIPPTPSGYPPAPTIPGAQPYSGGMGGPYGTNAPAPYQMNTLNLPVSDKSRIAAGVLQLIIPGVGRMYLGYLAQGVIQLLTTPLCGAGALWSYIDGIAILCGSTKLDGYGRVLKD
jgi:TM2 domain-containing membrane protein YozV